MPARLEAERVVASPGRLVWHLIGLVLALLLAWAVWRGYQNPDLLIELAAFSLC